MPEKIEDYEASNNFGSLQLYLDLEEDFETACSKVKKSMDGLKNSLLPIGTATYMSFLTWCFPQFVLEDFTRGFGSKHSVLVSNVPGYIKPVTYGGSPARKFFSFLSSMGSCASSVCVVTTMNNAQITLCSDEALIEDIPLLCVLFDKQIQ